MKLLFSLLTFLTLTFSAAANWIEFPIGVDGDGNPVIAHVTEEDFNIGSTKFRTLIVCEPGKAAELKKLDFGAGVSASIIEVGDGAAFPPKGTAYQGEHAVAQSIWRWLGMHAPDYVIHLRPQDDLGLLAALRAGRPCDVGEIPGVAAADGDALVAIEKVHVAAKGWPSPARLELQNRVARSPIEVAEALSAHYPGQVKSIAYIPAVALIGRMRTGELTENAEHLDFAKEQLTKWLEKKPDTPQNFSGAYISGNLMFPEYAQRANDDRAWDRTVEAGHLGLDADGKPLKVLPSHNQMSDAVFMGCPAMAEAGARSGDERFYVACVNQMRSIQEWCLREDGLYRHSPLDEAAWGRGNGFPVLGLSLSLSVMAEDFEGYEEVQASLTNHLAALIKHQDQSGMFHQVIDRPESYREFTSTCMITFSILRGLRNGWLDRATYEPVADRAWTAIKQRIALDGKGLVDVCTGTGKQKNLRAYYERKAILGHDDRGGAMALMVATERAFWDREKS
ncbi:MAG: glycoside hydrolase family 88 protein [Verrucomicrobiota bacterium]